MKWARLRWLGPTILKGDPKLSVHKGRSYFDEGTGGGPALEETDKVLVSQVRPGDPIKKGSTTLKALQSACSGLNALLLLGWRSGTLKFCGRGFLDASKFVQRSVAETKLIPRGLWQRPSEHYFVHHPGC